MDGGRKVPVTGFPVSRFRSIRFPPFPRPAAARAAGQSIPPDGGGGVYSLADELTIVDNRILTNTVTGGYGGGVLIAGGQFVLQDNQVISNTALAGGGVAVYTATGVVAHNRMSDNAALFGGGMYLWGAAQPAMDGNVVLSNSALGFVNPAAAGVLVNVDAGLPITLTNHIIARNAAGSGALSVTARHSIITPPPVCSKPHAEYSRQRKPFPVPSGNAFSSGVPGSSNSVTFVVRDRFCQRFSSTLM